MTDTKRGSGASAGGGEGTGGEPKAGETRPVVAELVAAGGSAAPALARLDQLKPGERWARLLSSWLGQRNRSTIRVYGQALDELARFLGCGAPRRDRSARKRDPEHEAAIAEGRVKAVGILLEDHGRANLLVHDWVERMRADGLSPNTVRMRAFAIKSLVEMASLGKMVAWQLQISPPKAIVYRDTRGPSDESTMRILDHYERRLSEQALAPGRRLTMLRDHAMVALMLGAGLRRFEVAALDVGDIDFDRRTVSIMGKGRDQAEDFPLEDWPLTTIAAWLEERGQRLRPRAPLFVSLDPVHRDSKITPGGVAFIISELAHELGIEDLRVHGLRHRFITEMTERVTDPAAIMKAARHKDFKTTLAYIDNAQEKARKGVLAVGDSLREKLDRWRKNEHQP